MSLPKNEELEKKLEFMQNEIAELKGMLNAKANVKLIYNCDMNELKLQGTGIYIAYSQVKNAPANTPNVHYHVFQSCYGTSGSYCLQIAVCLHSSKLVHIRRNVGNVWEEWTAI